MDKKEVNEEYSADVLAKWEKISESMDMQAKLFSGLIKSTNFNEKIKEIVDNIENANKIVSKIDMALREPFLLNNYKLFEVEVLNTVNSIDRAMSLLKPKSGISVVLERVKLKSLKDYFYRNKETIEVFSGVGNNYHMSTPLHILDLYQHYDTSVDKKDNLDVRDELILKKLASIEEEIQSLKVGNTQKLIQSFVYNVDTKKLIIANIEVSFIRAKKQALILYMIVSNKSKKRWELDEIIEFLGDDPFISEISQKWNLYLIQHIRSINDKVNRAGWHDKFLEYKDKALIVCI